MMEITEMDDSESVVLEMFVGYYKDVYYYSPFLTDLRQKIF
jgi:hypothetical protein